jgi:hypothetical protein
VDENTILNQAITPLIDQFKRVIAKTSDEINHDPHEVAKDKKIT